MKKIGFAALLMVVGLMGVIAFGQIATGGPYTLDQSVIAGGGGTSSAGAAYSLTGTAGQTAAGTRSTAPPLAIDGGFWQISSAPLAAMVAVGGRVTTGEGRGVRNAQVTLTNSGSVTRTVLTGSRGNFRFDDVEVGQTYIIVVVSRRFTFAPLVIQVQDELTNMDIIALPRSTTR